MHNNILQNHIYVYLLCVYICIYRNRKIYSIIYVTCSIKMCTYVYIRFTKSWISTNLNIVGHLIKCRLNQFPKFRVSLGIKPPRFSRGTYPVVWGEILHRFGIITNPQKQNGDTKLPSRWQVAPISTNPKEQNRPSQPIHFQLNPLYSPENEQLAPEKFLAGRVLSFWDGRLYF